MLQPLNRWIERLNERLEARNDRKAAEMMDLNARMVHQAAELRTKMLVPAERLEELLWESYSAGAENGYLHGDSGEALTYDHMREDFQYWIQSLDAANPNK